MHWRLRRLVRSAQVNLPPSLAEARHAVQRVYLRFRGRPSDPDFAILGMLKFAPDEVLLDVGANRGQSIDAMRLFHSWQPIVAFEALPALARRLTRAFSCDRHVDIHAVGLSDAPGTLKLSVPSYNGWPFEGQSSFALNRENLDYRRGRGPLVGHGLRGPSLPLGRIRQGRGRARPQFDLHPPAGGARVLGRRRQGGLRRDERRVSPR